MSSGEGRAFAYPVGGALLVVAGVLLWRGHRTASLSVGGAGLVLLVMGLLVPERLGALRRAWFAVGHAVSRVTTPVIMAGVYFAVLTPIGMIRRLLGGNPIRHEPVEGSYFRDREPGDRSSDMTRQF